MRGPLSRGAKQVPMIILSAYCSSHYYSRRATPHAQALEALRREEASRRQLPPPF